MEDFVPSIGFKLNNERRKLVSLNGRKFTFRLSKKVFFQVVREDFSQIKEHTKNKKQQIPAIYKRKETNIEKFEEKLLTSEGFLQYTSFYFLKKLLILNTLNY